MMPPEHITSARARRATDASQQVVADLERACISALLQTGGIDEIPRVLDHVAPSDFQNPNLGILLGRLGEMRELGVEITLPILADELDRAGELARIGGHVFIAEVADFEASSVHAVQYARRVRRHTLERQERMLHARAAADLDEGIREDLGKVRAKIEALDDERADTLESLAFSGERFCALADRPAPDPVEAMRPTPGHLSLWVAPAITGKSAAAYWSAMSRAAGVHPWVGAPARPVGRVLIYSLDEAPEQVARRMRSLSVLHPAGRIDSYAERILVLGPDREVEPSALEGLRLDSRALRQLDRWLERAAEAGDPFAEVYLDAYADMLPLGESENSNEEGTRIGGGLERLAVRHGCAITLLHHVGKPPKGETGSTPPDVRFLGRGASALAAKARTVASIEIVGGLPHMRRVRTATNLGQAPRERLFEVCAPEGGEGDLVFFRPAADPATRSPRDLISAGEEISTNELARRLAGDSLEEGTDPPGELKRVAVSLRESWAKAGLVLVKPGKRGAKNMALIAHDEAL